MRCWISRDAAVTIHAESMAAAPREACGLLLGEPGRIEVAVVAENVAKSPETRFEIDPTALFAALRAERTGGPKLLGYWHSHPSGDATPSATDAAMAEPDGKLWLILGGAEMTCWQARERGLHGRFAAVELVRAE